jgi:hypothetical protein
MVGVTVESRAAKIREARPGTVYCRTFMSAKAAATCVAISADLRIYSHVILKIVNRKL